MSIVTFSGLALVFCVIIITVKQLKPEFSTLLIIACGTVLTMVLLREIVPVVSQVKEMFSMSGVDAEVVSVPIKAIGICVCVGTAADVCRDAGQTAIASKIELGGRIAVLLVAMPLFRRLFSLAVELIGE